MQATWWYNLVKNYYSHYLFLYKHRSVHGLVLNKSISLFFASFSLNSIAISFFLPQILGLSDYFKSLNIYVNLVTGRCFNNFEGLMIKMKKEYLPKSSLNCWAVTKFCESINNKLSFNASSIVMTMMDTECLCNREGTLL